MNSGLRTVIAGYDAVSSPGDWFDYTGKIMALIFSRTWYNGDVRSIFGRADCRLIRNEKNSNFPRMKMASSTSVRISVFFRKITFYPDNKLVGGVLIIQERGYEGECADSLYKAFYGSCHYEQRTSKNFTSFGSKGAKNYSFDADQVSTHCCMQQYPSPPRYS